MIYKVLDVIRNIGILPNCQIDLILVHYVKGQIKLVWNSQMWKIRRYNNSNGNNECLLIYKAGMHDASQINECIA